MKRVVLSVLLGCACEAPPVFSGADLRQHTPTSRIEGSVVVSGAVRGNAAVFLYSAQRPPPPLGTGRPLAFTVLSQESLFHGAPSLESGPFTAPFAFSLVPAGDYLIRGFIDANADFVPWYGVTAEPNAGDVGGAVVNTQTMLPRTLAVTLTDDVPQPVRDVTVSFADRARVPTDRPVFEVSGPSPAPLTTKPLTLQLSVRALEAGAVRQASPVFLASFVDVNGDGAPDDSDADGAPDFWPRVVVRKLASAENPVLDENDLDRNGVGDETGNDYAHFDPVSRATIAPDGSPDVVVLAAAFKVDALSAQLLDAAGHVKPQPVPMTSLTLVVQPRALDVRDPAHPALLERVPSGRYAITLIQSTGQTWRVPNELAPGAAETHALPSFETQGFVIEVP